MQKYIDISEDKRYIPLKIRILKTILTFQDLCNPNLTVIKISYETDVDILNNIQDDI